VVLHPLIDVRLGRTCVLCSVAERVVLRFLLIVEKTPDSKHSVLLQRAEAPSSFLPGEGRVELDFSCFRLLAFQHRFEADLLLFIQVQTLGQLLYSLVKSSPAIHALPPGCGGRRRIWLRRCRSCCWRRCSACVLSPRKKSQRENAHQGNNGESGADT